MCRLGQVHVTRAHARPCWLARSPYSMPCEWSRSDLDDLWEIDQQQIRRDDMFSLSWVQTNLSLKGAIAEGPLVMVRRSNRLRGETVFCCH